jgi:membrane associated rhomboid family serine protease
MFPIRDTIRSRRLPLVNWALILTNVFVFLYEVQLSTPAFNRLINTYGLVSAHFNPAHLTLAAFIPFFTHMFLHSGWFHIISNMWVLFIFGDNVEDRLGSGRYLVFYILGGLAAAAMQTYISPHSSVPAIGASGAIAAVLGAYILFFPAARVLTLIPIFIIPWFIEVPAFIFIGIWFFTQLYSGLLSLAASGVSIDGIAWWAHIGGFIFGLLLAKPFAYRMLPRSNIDEYRPW